MTLKEEQHPRHQQPESINSRLGVVHRGPPKHDPDAWCGTVQQVHRKRFFVGAATNDEHHDVLRPDNKAIHGAFLCRTRIPPLLHATHHNHPPIFLKAVHFVFCFCLFYLFVSVFYKHDISKQNLPPISA